MRVIPLKSWRVAQTGKRGLTDKPSCVAVSFVNRPLQLVERPPIFADRREAKGVVDEAGCPAVHRRDHYVRGHIDFSGKAKGRAEREQRSRIFRIAGETTSEFANAAAGDLFGKLGVEVKRRPCGEKEGPRGVRDEVSGSERQCKRGAMVSRRQRRARSKVVCFVVSIVKQHTSRVRRRSLIEPPQRPKRKPFCRMAD